jgi:hypothetical protein
MVNRVRRLILVLRHAYALWRTLSLPKNAAKGDWRVHSLRELLDLAQREYEELFTAAWELECGKGTAQRVIDEAADLGAFAAMIADKARHKSRNN